MEVDQQLKYIKDNSQFYPEYLPQRRVKKRSKRGPKSKAQLRRERVAAKKKEKQRRDEYLYREYVVKGRHVTALAREFNQHRRDMTNLLIELGVFEKGA